LYLRVLHTFLAKLSVHPSVLNVTHYPYCLISTLPCELGYPFALTIRTFLKAISILSTLKTVKAKFPF